MIYTVTLNPALDYDMYLDADIKVGELNLTKEASLRTGGKGINVSRMMKTLDVQNTALGYVAGFAGEFILNDLQNDGIIVDFIPVDGNTRINVIAFDSESKKETEILGLSPIISEEKLNELTNKISGLSSGDTLVLSGSIPASISDTIYKEMAEHAGKDVKVVLDTRGNLIDKNLNNNFLIKPNIKELRQMFGEKLETKEEILEKVKYFFDKGIKNIIISRGGDGALLVNEEGMWEASVPKGELVNSIGAGDSLIGGFLAGLEKGYTTQDAFRLGIAAGSATAYSPTLGNKALVEKLYNEVTLIKKL